jgi:hypothetical protein
LGRPEREYRTLYGAKSELTCLHEVLADLRPNAKAITELRALFGDATPELRDAGVVGRELLETHLLCRARAARGWPDLCDIDADVELRHGLEHEHASPLAAHEMDHLAVSQVRSKDRIVTQSIGRHCSRADTPAWRSAPTSTTSAASPSSKAVPSSCQTAIPSS